MRWVRRSLSLRCLRLLPERYALEELSCSKIIFATQPYSKLYHSIVDDVFPQFTVDEQAVYMHLYRLSWGFNNPGVIVSLPKLAERAGMSRNSAARAIARLVGRGLVTKGDPFFGKNQEQGREYRLPIQVA